MITLQLTATTQSIIAKMTAAPATTEPQFIASWLDQTVATGATAQAGNNGSLNGTSEVTIVPAPATGHVVGAGLLFIGNRDTAQVNVLIGINDGSNEYLLPFTINAGQTLTIGTQAGPKGDPGTNGINGSPGPTAFTTAVGQSGSITAAWGHAYELSGNSTITLPSPVGNHGQEIIFIKPVSANTFVANAPSGVHVLDSTAGGSITHEPPSGQPENYMRLRLIAMSDTQIDDSGSYGTMVTA